MSLGVSEYENQRNLYQQQIQKAKETFDPGDMAARQLTESFAPLIGTESTLSGVKQLIGRARQAKNLINQVKNLKPNADGQFSRAAQQLRARVGVNSQTAENVRARLGMGSRPALPADAEEPIQMDDLTLDDSLPTGVKTPYPSQPDLDDPAIDQADHDDGFDQGVKNVDDYAKANGDVPEPADLDEIEGSDSFKMGARAGQLARLGQYADGNPLPEAAGDGLPISAASARASALVDTDQVLTGLQQRNWSSAVPDGKLAGQTAVRAAANNNLKLASGAKLSDADLASEELPERPPIQYNPETLRAPPTVNNESLGIDLARNQSKLAQSTKTLADLDDIETKIQTVKDGGGDVEDSLNQLATNRAAVQSAQQQAMDGIAETKARMGSSGPPEEVAPRTISSDSLQEQAYHDGLEGNDAPEGDGLIGSYAAGRADQASLSTLQAGRASITGATTAAEGVTTGAEGAVSGTEGAVVGGEATADTISAGLDALGPETGGVGFVLGGLVAAGSAIAAAVVKKKSSSPPPLPNFTVPSFSQGLI